ncbi:MAG: toxin-antitoxin system HicB family antitoxin [Thermoactinomyces sp.]
MKLEHGDPIPDSVPYDKEYSWKFSLRLPKSLHKYLVEQAEAENVSLNQYILYKFSTHVTNR